MKTETKALWGDVMLWASDKGKISDNLCDLYNYHSTDSKDSEFWKNKYDTLKVVYEKSLVKTEDLPLMEQIADTVEHLKQLRQRL